LAERPHKLILAGLMVTAVCAYVFSEDIGELMPSPGAVKKSAPDARARRKAVKAEDREQQEAIAAIFK
jgi:hypothetical protein